MVCSYFAFSCILLIDNNAADSVDLSLSIIDLVVSDASKSFQLSATENISHVENKQ